MEITDELIQRFIDGKCRPEEADAVAAWLRLHPERLASLLGGDDWQAAGDAEVSDHDPEMALEQVKGRLFPGEYKPVGAVMAGSGAQGGLRRLRWTAVAAAVLALTGVLVWLMQEGQQPRMAVTRRAVTDPAVSEAMTSRVTREIDRVNRSGQPQRLVLPDGSSVVLFAHSALHYTDSFGVLRRDVRLAGKADFVVARDEAHPFRVLTGRLATVVLGTSFEVRAPVKGGGAGWPADAGAGSAGGIGAGGWPAGDVAVRLYSGKVVIRSLQAMHGWKDIVLAPGEEMVYDDHRMMVKVNKPAARGGSRVDSAGGMGDLVFNNSPLKTVFQRLSQQYHKKIVYRASELEGLNFTGTLMRTDSLETILSLLGSTNNLDIHEQPAGFVVTRRKDNP